MGVVVLAVFFEGDEPAGVGRLNFIALPKTALDIVGIDFARQLPPDFVAAWPEDFSKGRLWHVCMIGKAIGFVQ